MVVFMCCGKNFKIGKSTYACDDVVQHNGRCSRELFRTLIYEDGEIETR